jgi:hypothetical protein
VSSIQASGASTVTSSPITTAPFALSLSGASRFDGKVGVKDATVELSGASRAVLSGSASTVAATVSGASQLMAKDLSIVSLTIDLSGASHGEVNVTGTISAGVSGASNLTCSGTPAFTRSDVSGGSAIGAS